MKNEVSLVLRTFTVTIRDERTGAESVDTITLSKEQLNAARLIHKTHVDLICWAFNREGYHVLHIEGPVKREIKADLTDLAAQVD